MLTMSYHKQAKKFENIYFGLEAWTGDAGSNWLWKEQQHLVA